MYIDNTTRIDRIVCSNVEVIGFTTPDRYKALERMGILENSRSEVKYRTTNNDEFTRIKVSDFIITDLVVGISNIKGLVHRYGIMTLTIKSDKCNLICYSVDDYYDYLAYIQKHLEDEYGILVDFSDIKIKSIELNKTFILANDFKEYHRVINLLMSNLPHNMRTQADYKKIEGESINYETYYANSRRSNNSRHYSELKIYDKTKELSDNIQLKENYMRVEIKLVGLQKVQQELGTNSFAEITDKTIDNYFNAKIHTFFVEPLKRWKKKRDKHLISLIKFHRKDNLRFWIVNVLRVLASEEIENKQPTILSLSELLNIIDELPEIETKRKAEIKRTFIKQANKYEPMFAKEDNSKLLEILTKLSKETKAPSSDGTQKAS